jgi:hypothetical protein
MHGEGAKRKLPDCPQPCPRAAASWTGVRAPLLRGARKETSLIIPCLARLLLLLGQAHVLPAAEMRRVLLQCSHADPTCLRQRPAYIIPACGTDVREDVSS